MKPHHHHSEDPAMPPPVEQLTGTEADFPLFTLLEKVRGYNPQHDADLLGRAYKLALDAHAPQVRKSGDPYFSHVYAVAHILAEMRMDTATVAAGLLHDTVEDTEVTLDEIEDAFGPDIRRLVYGVTKIGQYKFTDEQGKQAENFRNLVMATAKDIRVIITKLADRLHNIRTLHHVPEKKQKRIARETLAIFAPFANRLGMSEIKSELEERSFRFAEPEAYQDLRRKLLHSDETRADLLEEVKGQISGQLNQHGIRHTISGRPKHIYSIYQKMRQKQLGFEEIHDVLGVRIITEKETDCYSAFGLVHALWRPVQGRFKDYIATPKPNMYQSIHTTVNLPNSDRVEIQVRTREMHEIAEKGIAAHWVYKEKGKSIPQHAQKIFAFVQQFARSNEGQEDVREFYQEALSNILSDSVFVFTPAGEVRNLAKGSTSVDFAYDIHTEVGNTCAGARVNGNLVPLHYQLRHGDTVEVLTNKNSRPRKDWLTFTKTHKAKSRIQQYLNQHNQAENIELGRDILAEELKPYRADLKDVQKHPNWQRVLNKFSCPKTDDLFALIGAGSVRKSRVIGRLKSFNIIADPKAQKPAEETTTTETKAPFQPKEDEKLTIGGATDVLSRFARCCLPVYGDPVVGIVTKGRGISVHRRDCPNINGSKSCPVVPVAWGASKKNKRYSCRVRLMGNNRMGLAADINQAITNTNTPMNSSKLESLKGDLARGEMLVEVTDRDHLDQVLEALRKVKGVTSVARG